MFTVPFVIFSHLSVEVIYAYQFNNIHIAKQNIKFNMVEEILILYARYFLNLNFKIYIDML